jgi:hypothetical protein
MERTEGSQSRRVYEELVLNEYLQRAHADIAIRRLGGISGVNEGKFNVPQKIRVPRKQSSNSCLSIYDPESIYRS